MELTWKVVFTFLLAGRSYSKIMEDASDTEEEKFQYSDSNSSGQLKEANINMSAREVLDSCRGK